VPALRNLRRLQVSGSLVRGAARAGRQVRTRWHRPLRSTTRADRAGEPSIRLPNKPSTLLVREAGSRFHRAGAGRGDRIEECLHDRSGNDPACSSRRRGSGPRVADQATGGVLEHPSPRRAKPGRPVVSSLRRGAVQPPPMSSDGSRGALDPPGDQRHPGGDEPSDVLSGATMRSRSRSWGSGSVCGPTRSFRRTPRWPRRCTRSRVSSPG
jgi:hypothetical protein